MRPRWSIGLSNEFSKDAVFERWNLIAYYHAEILICDVKIAFYTAVEAVLRAIADRP